LHERASIAPLSRVCFLVAQPLPRMALDRVPLAVYLSGVAVRRETGLPGLRQA